MVPPHLHKLESRNEKKCDTRLRNSLGRQALPKQARLAAGITSGVLLPPLRPLPQS